ncbi:cupin domain-containing protein [Patescibacteria group bacterium]|nr:cupin domain-containing protein [Patescibacteria group bacterium]
MLIIRQGLQGIAVLDHSKELGQPGQYSSYKGDELEDLASIVAAAKTNGFEIRYYYKDLHTSASEIIPTKIIITDIPPMTVQKFHSHQAVHELSVVTDGEIVVIDSDVLNEADVEAIRSQGVALRVNDMVIEDPGVRHSVANLTDSYATFTTVQTARIPFERFEADWVR